MFLAAANCNEMFIISSVLRHARTLFVNIAHNACAVSQRGCDGYICHMDAGLPHAVRVFVELIRFHQWTAVRILYDGSAGMSKLHLSLIKSYIGFIFILGPIYYMVVRLLSSSLLCTHYMPNVGLHPIHNSNPIKRSPPPVKQ